jgi:hypothetical protein
MGEEYRGLRGAGERGDRTWCHLTSSSASISVTGADVVPIRSEVRVRISFDRLVLLPTVVSPSGRVVRRRTVSGTTDCRGIP